MSTVRDQVLAAAYRLTKVNGVSASSADIAKHAGVETSTASAVMSVAVIVEGAVPHGGHRNRTFSLKEKPEVISAKIQKRDRERWHARKKKRAAAKRATKPVPASCVRPTVNVTLEGTEHRLSLNDAYRLYENLTAFFDEWTRTDEK